MTGTITKKQHFVPRFYLERFADKDGFVWTYDATSDRVFPGKPEDVGFEKYFYSPKQKDGSRPTVIEDFFASIEGQAAPLFPLFETGQDPAREEREILSIFLAAQYLRSPMMLGVASETLGQVIGHISQAYAAEKELHDLSIDHLDQTRGEITPPEEREKMRAFISDPKNYNIAVLQSAGLPVLGGIPTVAKIFSDMNWFVCESPDQHLITCDSPVVLNRDPSKWHPVFGDGGLLGKTNFVTYPISPKLALELCWKGKPLGSIPRVEKQRGRLYNRQRAYGANRFLYYSSKDVGIAKLGAKVMGKERRNRLVQGPGQPEVKVQRKLG